MLSLSDAGGAIGSIAGGPVGAAVGSAIGSTVKVLGGLFGGGGVGYGTTQFDGLHSPTLPRIEASSMKIPEANIFRAYAQGLGISVEEVDLLMSEDTAQTGHDRKYVIDAWRQTNIPAQRNGSLRTYNQKNPLAQIHEGELGPRSTYATDPVYVPASAAPLPAVVVAPVQAPASAAPLVTAALPFSLPTTSANSFLGMGTPAPAAPATSLSDIIKAAVNGGIAAATDKALETPQGQAAKAAGFKSFMKDNQLIIAGICAAIVGAFIWAFNRKR